MFAHEVERLSLETELRYGLEERQFVVHYQPIYQLSDGSLQSFETLVRWEHPKKGLLAPGYFLSTAEENGMIVEIGEQVFQQACADLAFC